MSKYDVVVVGSSANALVAAAYLARARKRVLVLEPSGDIGGAVNTQEFADGFRGDVSLTSGRLAASIVRDLKLGQYGLEVIERDSVSSLLPDGRSFSLPKDRAAATEAIRKFSPADADKYLAFTQLLDLATDFLQSAYSATPPKAHHPSGEDLKQLMALAGRLRGYGRREMAEVMRLLVMSARDFLDEWFENEELKGLLVGPAIRGLTQGPFAGGTTFNLLHHLAIGDGYFRATARGGIGAITRALTAAAEAGGVEFKTAVKNIKVLITNGTATGVRLGTGETMEAETVVSDLDARETFVRLVDPFELEPEFNRAVRNVRYNGSVARINLALKELPEFKGLKPDALKGTLTFAPSIAYVEKAFDETKRGTHSTKPYMEVTLPSIADPSLAPAGKHVMSIWYQYATYKGKARAEQILEAALAQLGLAAPNLRSLVLHSQVFSAQDYESRFGLTEGHLYGADMTLAQALYLRPIPGYAQYRTPIHNLFVCGYATHPGGGLSGLAGVNAANEVGLKSVALTV